MGGLPFSNIVGAVSSSPVLMTQGIWNPNSRACSLPCSCFRLQDPTVFCEGSDLIREMCPLGSPAICTITDPEPEL
jgi:hypothetical protein